MRILRNTLIGASIVLLAWACGDDDGPQTIPIRDVAEVAAENDDEIREYLSSHFYNYEDFQEPVDPNFDFKIVFDTIAGDNANKTPMIDQVTERVVDIDDEGTIVPHTIYLLIVNEGGGTAPRRVDSTFVSYRGTLLNEEIFDVREQPIWFDMLGNPFTGGGVIRGFAESLTAVRSSEAIMDNGDGTVSYDNFGIAAAFIPSGIGYFANPPAGIPFYSPLVFRYNLFVMQESDHDGDGIPTYLEDLNEDDNFFNDDTDNDTFPNYADDDDDGDTLLTIDEIDIVDGLPVFTDCDEDGIPDYLDTTICPES